MANDIDLKKRFWVFEIPEFYPSGGLSDVRATTDLEEEAIKIMVEQYPDDGSIFDSINREFLSNLTLI